MLPYFLKKGQKSEKERMHIMIKTYVIDTNVLIQAHMHWSVLRTIIWYFRWWCWKNWMDLKKAEGEKRNQCKSRSPKAGMVQAEG